VKVLVSVPDLGKQGGIANYYATLRRYFPEHVEFLARGARTGGTRWLRMLSLVADYVTFAKAVHRYDLVHLNTSFARHGVLRDAVYLALARLAGRPVVVFFRGWDEQFESKVASFAIRPWWRMLMTADRMIVLSERFQGRLRSWGYTRPIDVETTVVDDAMVDGVTDTEIEERMRHRGERITALFLARVEPNKGVHEAITAHAALADRYPGLHLVIAGAGSALAAAQARVDAERIPRVDFLGYVRGTDKRAAFRTADIYIFPSAHAEGMPNSVLEAMAMGLPIVTTLAGGLRDFFVDGTMGIVVPPHDPRAIEAGIARLLDAPELRLRMAVTNHAFASQRFLASRVVARLMAIYAATIDGRSEQGTAPHHGSGR